jgi:4-amino-4-deoxychorismate lyase
VRFLETIRAEEGHLFHLEYHQRRMARTLDAFGIPVRYDLKSLLHPPAEGLIRCRVLYGEEGVALSYHPYIPRRFVTLQAVIDDTVDYAFKYADRRRLDALYEQHGASEEIVIVKNNLLTDATIANIALFDGTRWLTPKHPLLRGTTRERLLDEGKLEEAEITLDMLPDFERCALLNAMLDFVEVENGIIPPNKEPL